MELAFLRFARRGIAYLIDSILVFLLVRPDIVANILFRSVSTLGAALLDLSSLLLGTVYVIGCHWRWGCTLGKKFLGLRVATVEGISPPGFRAAFTRHLPFLAIAAGLFVLDWFVLPHTTFGVIQIGREHVSVFPLVPFIWILLDVAFALRTGGYRSLHDIIGGTVVTDVSSIAKSA